MKTFIQKISSLIRELFAFLRVTVTLQLGKAKVSKEHNLNTEDKVQEKED